MKHEHPFPSTPWTAAEAQEHIGQFSYDHGSKSLEVGWLPEEFLDFVFRYPETRLLNLDGTYISDDGLARLAKLANVETITIHGAAQINGVGFAAWADHPSLREVVASLSPLDDRGLIEIARIKSLTLLSIGNSKITDAGMESVAKLKGLTALSLARNNISDTGVRVLCISLSKLERFYLDKTSVTPEVVTDLARLEKLRCLWLGRNSLAQRFLKNIGTLEQLDTLSLRSADLAVEDLPALAGLTTLKELDLWGVNLRGADLSWMKHLKAIEVVRLNSTQLGDQEFATLEIVGPLRYLDLDSTQITDASIPRLKNLSHVRKLGVGSFKLTDASIEFIVKLQWLEELYFWGSGNVDNAMERLKAELPHTKIYGDTFSFHC